MKRRWFAPCVGASFVVWMAACGGDPFASDMPGNASGAGGALSGSGTTSAAGSSVTGAGNSSTRVGGGGAGAPPVLQAREARRPTAVRRAQVVVPVQVAQPASVWRDPRLPVVQAGSPARAAAPARVVHRPDPAGSLAVAALRGAVV